MSRCAHTLSHFTNNFQQLIGDGHVLTPQDCIINGNRRIKLEKKRDTGIRLLQTHGAVADAARLRQSVPPETETEGL